MTIENVSAPAPSGGRPLWPREQGQIVLDETNDKILQLLAHRGRSSMRDIADAVGRTESTVRDRVASLERHGIVRGYEARIDWAMVGLPVLVMFEAYCPPDHFLEVTEKLRRIPNVVHAVATTGSRNLLALVRTRDMADVRKILVQLSATALVDVQTRITLEHLVEERPPRAPPEEVLYAGAQLEAPIPVHAIALHALAAMQAREDEGAHASA